MAEVVHDLEEQSVYDYLKRLTDVHRLHLFDVVMQYRAIFSDDSSIQVLLTDHEATGKVSVANTCGATHLRCYCLLTQELLHLLINEHLVMASASINMTSDARFCAVA